MEFIMAVKSFMIQDPGDQEASWASMKQVKKKGPIVHGLMFLCNWMGYSKSISYQAPQKSWLFVPKKAYKGKTL